MTGTPVSGHVRSPADRSADRAGSRAAGGGAAHTGMWTIGPLLLAGLGSGLVISPNQTITLAQVPVEQAGAAGGVLQTG